MKVLFTILLILQLLHLSSYAKDQMFSVEDYIDFLVTKHVKTKVLQSNNDISNYDYKIAMALTDWQLSSSYTNAHTEPFQSSSFSTSYINSYSGNFGLSRPLLETGGSVSFGITQQRIIQPLVQFNGINFNQANFYQNTLNLTYSQPLLFGVFGEVYQLPIQIASSNVKITELNSDESMETFLQEELALYIDWVLYNELTELSFSRLQLARKSYQQTKQRVRVNLAERIDLLRAESALERAHQLWLTQKANLKSFQFKLSSKFDDQTLLLKTPMFALYDTVYVKKPAYVVIDRLRVVESFGLNKSTLEKQLSLSESKRNGNLNLVGTVDLLGSGTNYSDSQKYIGNNSSISLQYSRALGDIESITEIKKNASKLKQFELEETQLVIDLESEIIALYTLIEEYKNILEINLNQIMLAQQQQKAEQKLYQQGRTSIDMVIQSQDNVLNTKLNYANLSAAYQKYILTYQSLTDELIDKYGVQL